jgi:transposase
MGFANMEEREVFSRELGLSGAWEFCEPGLDIEKRPHELRSEVVAERGALFPCPACGRACKAHDFARFSWQHLNFF